MKANVIKLVNITLASILFFITLMGWWVPPGIISVILGVTSFIYFLARLILYNQHEIGNLFSVFAYATIGLSSWIYHVWETEERFFEPITMMRIVLVVFFILSILGLFAYYRFFLAVKHRRGNIVQDKLVVEEPTLKEYLERLFQRNKAPREINALYFNLGEQVERNDD